MIRVAICDDDDKELSRTKIMSGVYAVQHPELELQFTIYQNPMELQRVMNEQVDAFDILLVDIYMPELTGVELAQAIRKQGGQCQLIFVTTSLNHAVDAFSLHAAHYLVKPYTAAQLEDAFDKAITEVQKERQRNIVLKTLVGTRRVNTSQIVYSETDKHIQNIFLTGREQIQVRISNSEFYELLAADPRFFKCGSTYIINLAKIMEITTQQILFDDGMTIPVQRRQYRELLDRYTGYSLEGF